MPTFKGCLQRIDSSGQILGSEQISPKNCQENQRIVNLPLERGLIREYLEKNIPQSVIARLLGVSWLTVRHYIRTRKLQKSATQKL